MFAALVIERPLMNWSDLPAALRGWAQTVGVIAAIALLIWSIAYLAQNRRGASLTPKTTSGRVFLFFWGLSLLLFGFLALTLIGRRINIRALQEMAPSGSPTEPTFGDWAFGLAGLCALLAVASPFLIDLFTRMRVGRIWALARLSIKEAIRSKVVLVFAMIALIFLVADWFVPYKPEDQLRNYVAVIYLSLPPLFLVTTSLLGAFSIPADIRSQSIHTVVTKPVEKFEIVLGRFLGYTILMTVGLAIVTALSLVYVVRGIHPDAQRESFKARVPIYGRLEFEGTAGESVGRVWNYRKYIGGRNVREGFDREQFARWSFDELPSDLGKRREPVRFEFTFDIYRMTKGQENRGVFCNFLFVDGRLDRKGMATTLERFRDDRDRYQAVVTRRLNEDPAAVLKAIEEQVQADYQGKGFGDQAALALKLAREHREQAGAPALDGTKALRDEVENVLVLLHGVYDPPTAEVKDYHTLAIEVPPQLFRYLAAMESVRPRTTDSLGAREPTFRVWVNVDSSERARVTNAPQMVGMAEYDLYILAGEKPFWQNFIKGIIGLWCTFVLVLGVAVPCSTYLSGVITWLGTMFLFFAGMFRDFVQKLAEGRNDGGGPMVSIYRIFSNTFHSGALDDSPTAATLQQVDAVYQFVFRLILNILPDVQRFDLQEYVANGFDIAWGRLLLLECFLPLVGYLIPWMLLGYYLIKYREIANPN